MPSCVQSQMSPTKHLILSAHGSQWMETNLVMFTVYIDDSGTDPKQNVAIAAALVVPAVRLEAFDEKWRAFLKEELISGFHTSECVAGQKKTDFEKWSSSRKKHVCFRVREIAKEFSVKAFSFSVHKADYDEIVPENDELRTVGGGKHHYTWAVRHTISFLDSWALTVTKKPFEYVFDCMGKDKKNERKQEIEMVLAQADSVFPGRYIGHYSFRNREEHPGLQCVDLLAWSSYQFSLNAFTGSRLHPIAEDTFWDFENHLYKTWLFGVTMTRADLADWARRERSDPRSLAQRKRWVDAHRK